MILNNPFPFSTSYKTHILIGAILGTLLGFILIVLEPFNINNFNHIYKEVLFMGFGFIKFTNYVLAHFVENYFYNNKNTWTWWNEIIFLILSSVSAAVFGYFYLDIVFERQPLSLLRLLLFFIYIVLPILPLIIFPKLVLRYVFTKNSRGNSLSQEIVSKNERMPLEKITLHGNNAKDELTIYRKQLLYVKSIDNYVMIFYKDEQIKSVMLRSKLSDIVVQAPFLIQAHRSYLVNSEYSFKIVGNSQKASLTSNDFEEVIPIARSYYKTMRSLFN
ncbi:LytTR family DNA-binding domain-containing protein [Aquimarina macrocephali]|uniref:LytTR family DNA-binding domain-containing protein n=1 Tax=Aquimarina macrocephali TaxID=666563 RepID=UPI003F681A29